MDASLPTLGGTRSTALEEAIRRRAQELYEQHGRLPGHEVEDWLQAEAEVTREAQPNSPAKPAFVVVKLHGVTYTGEYDAQYSDGYKPGELAAGNSVRVRFQKDRMYITRPNGTELETRIVKSS